VSALVERARTAARTVRLVAPEGRVAQVVGTVVEVRGLGASVGDICFIDPRRRGSSVAAEVVGFREDRLLLMPYEDLHGIAAGDRVSTRGESLRVPVGRVLLGRVIDAFGHPVDGGPPIESPEQVGPSSCVPRAMARKRLDAVQQTGVRAIDAFVPCARGQRVGIMAGSGVGKSVLLGMISRHSDADVNVVALIGERGREVREFVEEDLGPEGLARSVVVVATGDQSPVLRIRAAQSAMSIAEWFRDRDHNVMMVMDSVTRFAMAQREIGLAVGEPPTTKGYPPSTFSLLARLLERAGTSEVNAMTAFFTVLVEGDDLQDPIGDAVRSIVDGHLVLKRELADRGHYPAIDVRESVSRLANAVSRPEQLERVRRLKLLMTLLKDNEDLVNIGAYVRGTNPDLDKALELRPAIDRFLQQPLEEHVTLEETLRGLTALGAAAG
jgi:flagellum-specific ATP synthase